MILADYGADVVRIDREVPTGFGPVDTLSRRKRSVVIDLKLPSSKEAFLALTDVADILIDPFRPNVLEKLGLGPEVVCQRNPRLIYARLSGFRRDGTYAERGGHDINYLAVSGVLSLLGRKESLPTPPVNLLADFGGGGAVCAMGILLALIHRASSGKGQVVEANMVDGSAYLATFARQHLVTPAWDQPRGENLLDGAAPFYEVYETKEGDFVAVGAMEPQFYAHLLNGLELSKNEIPDRDDRANWPALKKIFQRKFAEHTLSHWREVFDGVDACVTPVLKMKDVEGPYRPLVGLSQSPSLDVADQEEFPVLHPGTGSMDVLENWLSDRNDLHIDQRTKMIYSSMPTKAKL